MALNRWIEYNRNINPGDLDYLHPSMFLMLGYVNQFCAKRGIRLVLSSIIRSRLRDQQLGAISKTHQQGRAVDISIRSVHGWTNAYVRELEDDLNLLCDTQYLENKFPNPFYQIGAIAYGTLEQVSIVVHGNHNGIGNHAHLQVRPTDWWSSKNEKKK